MNEEQLTDMAAKVFKSLHWAAFLVIASLMILVIDLQLKRSIARTAVVAAGRHDAIVKMADSIMADLTKSGSGHGRTVVAAGDRAGSSAGGGGVDGDAPVAASASGADGEAAGVPAAAPGGPRKRPPGNGRRAVRPDTGS